MRTIGKMMLEIGVAVRKRRKELRLTQEDLAGLAGCSALFVGDVEKGKESVQIDKLVDLLDTLGYRLTLTDRNTNVNE